LYSGQLSEGARYSELKKTICINILNFNYLKNDAFRSVFHLREDLTGELLSDDEEIHFIELPKFEKTEVNINDKLEGWLLFLKDPNNKAMETIMEREEKIKEAVTYLDLISQSKAERERYEERRISQAFYEIALQKAEEHGTEEGIQKGIQRGVFNTTKKLKEMGLEISKIVQATGLSESEVNKL
jgi:predicted transposase/invertase (TIGR01784 family)